MKKLLVIGVIVLFLGLAVAPSINANINKESELVEITTKICEIKEVNENSGKRYVIFGSGDISGIYLANMSWYFRGEFRGFYRGDLILDLLHNNIYYFRQH